MDLQAGKRLAAFYEVLGEDRVQCKLCPRGCKLGAGKIGFCGTRQNIGGKLYTLIYGKAVRVAQEYAETEGVFHFAPGAPILSLGNMGCNLHCKFCQNWKTSQMKFLEANDYEVYTPQQVVDLALNKGIHILSWTYNDPAVWQEFVVDTARLARRHGLLNLYKSAFYLTLDAVKELCEVMDIFSISLKSIREDYYRQHCQGTLAPILENIRYVYQTGLHLEVSNLMVTDLNDTEEDARNVIKWHLENTSPEVPLHFVAFHPAYQYPDVPRTPADRLERAQKIAFENGVKYCYLGNLYDHPGSNTYCPSCKQLLIKRFDINVEVPGLTPDGHCKHCGTKTPIQLKPFENVQRVAAVQYDQNFLKETYRWSDEINRLHIEVNNPDQCEQAVVVERLNHLQTRANSARQSVVAPQERYRFIVSKSSPDETGVVICYPPQLKIRISELLDRAHLPTEFMDLGTR